ncbi:MAG: hypothetical protein M1522_02720 [Actinobacteria bacterium]|jgi:hypothetical protein|nr:hypothetical protein [Actinomycetota bacterium]
MAVTCIDEHGSASWFLVDAVTADGAVRAFVVDGDTEELVVYGSAAEFLAATGGCHVEEDGQVVSVRLDGQTIDATGKPCTWRIGWIGGGR